MGAKRTAWHVFFGQLLAERAAAGIEVQQEVSLGPEPQRVDYLLLRRDPTTPVDDASARVLRRLWPRIRREALLEYKSIKRPFAYRDLERLLGYGLQWWCKARGRLTRHQELLLVLVVARRTAALVRSAVALGWQWIDEGDGYNQLVGAPFEVLVVELDVVARSERDELVATFGHAQFESGRMARRWWAMHTGMIEGTMRTDELEDFDEIVAKFVATLTRDQRLSGLSPAERLEGLGKDDTFRAMPDWLLRSVDPKVIDALPEPLRTEIRERIARRQ